MDRFQRFMTFGKKPAFILGLILLTFFFKGLFLTSIHPMLKGQDETRHYVTIQYLAEENRQPAKSGQRNKVDGFEKYYTSEELEKTIALSRLSDFQGSPYSKPVFSESFVGQNEAEIQNSEWEKDVRGGVASKVGNPSPYHHIASLIEKSFRDSDILVRFFLIRLFSVLLGTLTVFLSYYLAKNVGLSPKASLLAAAAVCFQPKFSEYTTNINYDALLIPVFVLFSLIGILLLKNGFTWKNTLSLMIVFIIGIFTKGTAIIFIGPLLYLIFVFLLEKIKSSQLKLKNILPVIIFFVLAATIFLSRYGLKSFMPAAETAITPIAFLMANFDRFDTVSNQYWGNLDWAATDFGNNFIQLIWATEAAAVVGVIWFFLSQKTPTFLPQKKYVIFLLLMLLSLQVGILFNNWRITNSGAEKLLSSPGRYFLPNLPAHIILILTGVGMILRKNSFFLAAAALFVSFMSIFGLYLVFNVIIPRYYF